MPRVRQPTLKEPSLTKEVLIAPDSSLQRGYLASATGLSWLYCFIYSCCVHRHAGKLVHCPFPDSTSQRGMGESLHVLYTLELSVFHVDFMNPQGVFFTSQFLQTINNISLARWEGNPEGKDKRSNDHFNYGKLMKPPSSYYPSTNT